MPPSLISPRNNGLEYFELLSMIDARLVRGCEVPGLCDAGLTERVYWIRHDVDHRPEDARVMAEAETQHDVKSTYFFLHGSVYWHSLELKNAIEKIIRLGHDIGLHNNVLTLWLKHRVSPGGTINAALNRLRMFGSTVKMTSAHGDKHCHEKEYYNYEIWNDCPAEYQRCKYSMPRKNLEDYGLIEAYFTQRDAYLTDSGASWHGQIGNDIPPFEQFDEFLGPVKTIERFNLMDTGVLQLLIHPCWWEGK